MGAALIAMLVLAGCTSAKTQGNGNNSGTTTTAKAASAATGTGGYGAVDPCTVLTSSIAGQILGSAAIKATSPAGQQSTSDIAYADCVYDAGPNVDPPHIVSLAVRSAKDSAGATSNKQVFTGAGRPPGVQNVTGYGDAAYWDPSLGQLDILKGNNWYLLNNYTGTAPTNGTATLAMAEQLAQALTLH